MRRTLGLLLVSILAATTAGAWPVSLVERLNRDARRLLPVSLRDLLLDREKEILAEAQRLPPDRAQALALDLVDGHLSPVSFDVFNARADEAVGLIRQRRVSEGLIKLGALVRISADLADPVLSVGPDGYPPGVAREYYAFVESNLDKIPVVLEDAKILRLDRKGLPAYWQGVLDRSRQQSPVIRSELFRDGRVVSHQGIDYRSPVFSVASLSYSRAVNAIATTWLAVWREVRGDLTRMPVPKEVQPRETQPKETP
jgi:hypothetical protein